MKTLSITEFKALVSNNSWTHEQTLETVDRFHDDSSIIVSGEACKISTQDGITITYREGYTYNDGDLSSLSHGVEGLEDVFTIEGVIVVDQDGDELDTYDLIEYLPSTFSDLKYSDLKYSDL